MTYVIFNMLYNDTIDDGVKTFLKIVLSFLKACFSDQLFRLYNKSAYIRDSSLNGTDHSQFVQKNKYTQGRNGHQR